MFNDKYGLNNDVLKKVKTMTRRLANCPKTFNGKYVSGFRVCTNQQGYQFTYLVDQDECEIEGSYDVLSKYKIGEVIAIAQSYKDIDIDPHFLISAVDDGIVAMDSPGWTNKMFVRAELMIHHIRITNVRFEHLQNISDEDCLKEGIKMFKNCKGETVYGNNTGACYTTPKSAFMSLIDGVSDKGTWESNPWVEVYEFELLD